MRAPYHTLDVFTDRIFGGNPLAIFPDAAPIPPSLLGAIARELNLSETVFVYPPESPAATRRVRIFTPAGELPFAGHPTVGTAWFLVASGRVATPSGSAAGAVTVVLEEGVGPVSVEVSIHDGRPTSARLTTAAPHREWPLDAPPAALAAMLGVAPDDIGLPGGLPRAADSRHAATTALEPAIASAGIPFLIVPLRSAAAVARARLDDAARRVLLRTAPPGTMVYPIGPAAGPDTDLHTRMFAPEIGVPEDPATGSACAALGGYLAARLDLAEGESAWRVAQGVEMGRPSLLELDVLVEGGRPIRVRVGGRCVEVARAEITIPV